MNLLQGKLTEKLELEKINTQKGEMLKMRFVIQTPGQYGKPVCFETLNNNVITFMTDTKIGTEVEVKFDVSSREYTDKNGKKGYFTSVTAFGAEKKSAPESMEIPSSPVIPPTASEGVDDLPF